MDAIALGGERARTVLQRLRHTLNDAKIGYESVEGVHSFLIQHGGTRFRVQFTERTLIKKSPLDIEAAINKVVESVLCVTDTV